MKRLASFITFTIIATVLTINSACQKNATSSDDDLNKTLELVEEVSEIPGGENATITVNRNDTEESYFSIEFSNINPNDILENGVKDSWCIDVRAPLDTDNGTYRDIQLYSTYLVDQWRPVNYLFSMREELKVDNPDLTWREFQIAIWALRTNPEFNLNEISMEELPDAFKKDGQLNFSIEKVNKLLDIAEAGYEDFDYAEGSKYAVIAATPPEVQTVITFVER